jgi:hypothetical protein
MAIMHAVNILTPFYRYMLRWEIIDVEYMPKEQGKIFWRLLYFGVCGAPHLAARLAAVLNFHSETEDNNFSINKPPNEQSFN